MDRPLVTRDVATWAGWSAPCPVPWCRRDAARGHAMCLPCWRLCSPAARRQLEAAFLAWCRGKLADRTYSAAITVAVDSVRRARSEPGTVKPDPLYRPGRARGLHLRS